MREPVGRPLTASDGPSARRLAERTYAGTRYLARTVEMLELALAGSDPECVGLVSGTPGDIDALMLHGPLAGAVGVEKVHALIGSDVQTVSRLLAALGRASHWRMIVCELPADHLHATTAAAVVSRGFTREGSVPGFVSDDIGLALMVLRRA